MYMTEQQRLEARALASSLDKLTREPRRFSPTAPWIIPATMIFVAIFSLVCLIMKLFLNYLNSKQKSNEKLEKTPKKFSGLSHASSPDIPTTPEDQASMATTASMKTRGSLRLNSKRGRTKCHKPPPVSLYQMKQTKSPGSASLTNSSSKLKTSKAAMKAMSRMSRAEANKSSLSRDSKREQNDDNNSDDNLNSNDNDDSPTNLSQHSEDVITDEIQNVTNSSGIVYAAATGGGSDQIDTGRSSEQPEVHIVRIMDMEDGATQQANWHQTESEI